MEAIDMNENVTSVEEMRKHQGNAHLRDIRKKLMAAAKAPAEDVENFIEESLPEFLRCIHKHRFTLLEMSMERANDQEKIREWRTDRDKMFALVRSGRTSYQETLIKLKEKGADVSKCPFDPFAGIKYQAPLPGYVGDTLYLKVRKKDLKDGKEDLKDGKEDLKDGKEGKWVRTSQRPKGAPKKPESKHRTGFIYEAANILCPDGRKPAEVWEKICNALMFFWDEDPDENNVRTTYSKEKKRREKNE
jgi:hypothetical protein